MLAYRQAEQLQKRAGISQNELRLVGGKVDLTIATLEGLNDDYAEELDQLKLEIRRKQAEFEQAIAQKATSAVDVSRNLRLNVRTPGVVSDDGTAKAEAELRSAHAHVQVKQIELEESELRHTQLERKRARIGQILESARRPASTAAPGDQPVKPAAPQSK